MPYKSNISAIILSAGFSKRMKMNKTELRFDNNHNFFQKITEEYLNFGCKEVIVVMNSENYKSLKSVISIPEKIEIIINEKPDKGKFYSLYKGVQALKGKTTLFIQNIDNPFVTKGTLKLLANNSYKADYIIPSYKNKGGHPILISEKITQDIKNSEFIDYNLKEFLNSYQKLYIETDNKKISANINTDSDYHLYF